MKKEQQNVVFNNFEDWEIVARSGNFVIKKFDDEELKYYAVKAVAGHWCEVIRNDHPMFRIIESFVSDDDENAGDIIDLLVTMHYTIAACAPDQQFVEEFFGSVESLHQRMDDFEQAHRTQSDEEVLAEDAAADEAEEKFQNFVEEHSEE